jgi:hypothetical protein
MGAVTPILRCLFDWINSDEGCIEYPVDLVNVQSLVIILKLRCIPIEPYRTCNGCPIENFVFLGA